MYCLSIQKWINIQRWIKIQNGSESRMDQCPEWIRIQMGWDQNLKWIKIQNGSKSRFESKYTIYILPQCVLICEVSLWRSFQLHFLLHIDHFLHQSVVGSHCNFFCSGIITICVIRFSVISLQNKLFSPTLSSSKLLSDQNCSFPYFAVRNAKEERSWS